MTDTTTVPPEDPPVTPPPDFLEPNPPPEGPPDELVRQLTFDEILRDHMYGDLDVGQMPNINPLAAPPLLGSAFTVTVANPTPPTNIPSVACGTPPHYTATYSGTPHAPLQANQVTYTDDAALFLPAGAAGSLTAIATPVAGGSGPTSEATGTVVVVTAPGSVAVAPTQSISVQGNFTATPNASHPSMQAPSTLPTITALTPAAPVGTGGSTDLVVTGTGFRSDSVVMVNGIAQNTQYVSATSLHVLNAPKRTSAGASAIVVMTGGTPTASSTWTFT